jgi:hypothetical protein
MHLSTFDPLTLSAVPKQYSPLQSASAEISFRVAERFFDRIIDDLAPKLIERSPQSEEL